MKVNTSFSIDEKILESLQKEAEKQKRSTSQLAEIYIEQGLTK